MNPVDPGWCLEQGGSRRWGRSGPGGSCPPSCPTEDAPQLRVNKERFMVGLW